MKPHRERFIKHHFGGGKLTDDYFLYTGIFMHFWGLYERSLVEVLFANKEQKRVADYFKNNQLCSNSTREKILRLTRRDLKEKQKIVDEIIGKRTKNKVNNKIKKLRNTIGHDAISYVVTPGVYSPRPGWVKNQKDVEDSFPTYDIEEIISITYELISVIRDIQYNVSEENVYKWLRKEGKLI